VSSVFASRAIFHDSDETICVHVFCSFLAFVLRYELQTRLQAKRRRFVWAKVTKSAAAPNRGAKNHERA
jgi:hypothetical protein